MNTSALSLSGTFTVLLTSQRQDKNITVYKLSERTQSAIQIAAARIGNYGDPISTHTVVNWLRVRNICPR